MKRLCISALLSIFYNSTRIPLETSLSVKNAALSRLRERLLSKTYEASQAIERSLPPSEASLVQGGL